MANIQSPFIDMAGYVLPDDSYYLRSNATMAKAQSLAAYSRVQAYQRQQYNSMPMQPGMKLDLDALLAAASCKPGCAAVPEHSPASSTAAAADSTADALAEVLSQYNALHIAHGTPAGIAKAAVAAIAESGVSDTFYVYDMGEVARLHATWVATMPRVMPFYAVKCNPEPGMVAMLNALGAGFDCASIQELKCAAAHNVPQSRIVFANPCKRPADFRYARENGIEYTTFDCVSELEKIAAGYPAFKCVLRIRCDDTEAKINLGLKYGADLQDVPMLLGTAKNLGLQVVGVSFHVGSGCQNVGVYADAILAAREAFDMAAAFGYTMELLDIGGGFTAPYDETTARLFYKTAGVINGSLHRWFPPGCGVRIIAEPGRYFAETSATLFTTILGQRDSRCADGQPFRDYWLSDGTYGSFRIQVAVDGLEPSYSILRSPLLPPVSAADEELLLPCRLWGNSDRDGDVVQKAALLPSLRDGDWLMFPYAGAYTICAASNYGGVCFTQPLKVFVYSADAIRDFGGYDTAQGKVEAGNAASFGVSTGIMGSSQDGVCVTGEQSGDDESMISASGRLSPCVESHQALTFERCCKSSACDSAAYSYVTDSSSGTTLYASLTESAALTAADAQVLADSAMSGGDSGACAVGEVPAAFLACRKAISSSDNSDCMSVASDSTAVGVADVVETELDVSCVCGM